MADTPDASPESAHDEPLARLYHMSTTAGVGTQEYVAINVFAVISVVLGLASALLLMGWDNPTLFYALLVIPVAGLVFAVAAISQIRGSNGTQAGIGWALGGVVLSLIFAGTVTAHHVQRNLAADREQQAIRAVVGRFNDAIMQRDYAAARQLFTTEFQGKWSEDAFRRQLEPILTNERLGRLEGMRASDRVDLKETASGLRAGGRIFFDFEQQKNAPISTQYQKVNDAWRIESSELFPAAALQAER